MRTSTFLTLAAAVTGALASPIDVSSVEERGLERRLDTSSHCGQWDTVAIGTEYILYLDQWGISGSSGSDCAQLTSYSGTTVAWTTTWSWTAGSGGVKTYTNIAAATGLNKQLSAIKSIPTTWKWSTSYSGSIVADVAYDLFTSASSGGSNAYEIMIWMANYNAGPISYTYSSSGSPTPIATVSLAGYTWSVYYGSNGSNLVYSFLPSSTITSFSADLKVFFTYLTTSQGLSSSQYLTTAEAGTEATSGTSVKLTTSAYSLVIN